MENLQLAAEEVTNGYRRPGNAAFTANIYNDPMLGTHEFVKVKLRLGFPNLVDQ
jgi:hypothetical protein